MRWLERLWRSPARKYLIIAALLGAGMAGPVAISVGTGLDQGISEIVGAERGEETKK